MATGADQCWSMDFVSDQLADGRSFRILTVVDQFTRECVGLEADRSMTGMKVAQALERAQQERGSLPESITVDNGSEFCSRALEAWAMGHDVQLRSICRSTHHARKCRLVSSGPLSQRIAKGCPRSATIASSTRVTRRLAKLVSTSNARHSRV